MPLRAAAASSAIRKKQTMIAQANLAR